MDSIREIMRIIDDNSSKIDEGDYLRLCNLMKTIFSREDSREAPKLFDYDNFDFEVDEGDDYYKNHYLEMSKQNDFDFLEFQRGYLFSEFDNWNEIKRMSRAYKIAAITHVCNDKGIILDEYTPEEYETHMMETNQFRDKKELKTHMKEIYSRYLKYENKYRHMYRTILSDRCDKIDNLLEDIYDLS